MKKRSAPIVSITKAVTDSIGADEANISLSIEFDFFFGQFN